MDQRSGDRRLSGRSTNHRALLKEILISRISSCSTRGLCLLFKRSSRIPTSKKKVSLEGTESHKKRSVPSRKSDRLHDLRFFPVTDVHDTVLEYADLFTVALRNDDIQEFDTRWQEILMLMTKFPPDDLLES